MRLCWIDGLRGPLERATPEQLQFVHDIGYRVAGIQADPAATDAGIARARRMGHRWTEPGTLRPY